MAKHVHKIMINKQKGNRHFTYDFGNTKNIFIDMSRNAICITAELTKVYDRAEMLSQGSYLFPDAIKKALMLHLILYSENINIKTISVQIDDDCETIVDTAQGHIPPIYSLVIGKLEHPFVTSWDNTALQGILSQTKTKADSRMAALAAFIISKSKHFESERFIYLWMAFNGMYGFFAKKISETHNDQPVKREYKQIIYMQELLGIGCETIQEEDKSIIAHEVIALIRRCSNEPATRNALEEGHYRELAAAIEDKLVRKETLKPYQLSAYGYLLTQFSYYFRCNLIHGNKPLALFSYADEVELKCLRMINGLLEEFMEENLHRWFDEAYVCFLTDEAAQIKL